MTETLEKQVDINHTSLEQITNEFAPIYPANEGHYVVIGSTGRFLRINGIKLYFKPNSGRTVNVNCPLCKTKHEIFVIVVTRENSSNKLIAAECTNEKKVYVIGDEN